MKQAHEMSAATKLSWASAASSVKAATALECVQLDGQAILKIVKHCQECQPSLVTGQLLGLDVGATLEVTNCFPFPVRPGAARVRARAHASNPQSRAAEDGAEDDETDGASYQLEMMRCLREVNVDNNTVGWCAHASGRDHARAWPRTLAWRLSTPVRARRHAGTSPRTWGPTRRWS